MRNGSLGLLSRETEPIQEKAMPRKLDWKKPEAFLRTYPGLILLGALLLGNLWLGYRQLLSQAQEWVTVTDGRGTENKIRIADIDRIVFSYDEHSIAEEIPGTRKYLFATRREYLDSLPDKPALIDIDDMSTSHDRMVNSNRIRKFIEEHQDDTIPSTVETRKIQMYRASLSILMKGDRRAVNLGCDSRDRSMAEEIKKTYLEIQSLLER
jgi:hypothetical protein